MAAKDWQYSRDETWRVRLEAFTINAFVYKAIGAAVHVDHWERTGGFLGLFSAERWTARPAESIRISNTYFGLMGAKANASAAGQPCVASNESSLDCRLWSVGIGISMEASASPGGPDPSTTKPSPSATLDVRAVRSHASVRVAGQNFSLSAEAGQFGPSERKDELKSPGGGPPLGNRISCATSDAMRISRVGGVHPDGRAWSATVAEAVAAIERGHQFNVEQPTGDVVHVVVAQTDRGRKFIKTTADGDIPNNLLALPPCP